MPDPKALAAIAAADRAALEQLAAVALDTLTTLEEWLGHAATRQAATDSLHRLARAFRRAAVPTYTPEPLQWRASVLQALERAGVGIGDDDELRLLAPDQPRWQLAHGRPLAEVLAEHAARRTAA